MPDNKQNTTAQHKDAVADGLGTTIPKMLGDAKDWLGSIFNSESGANPQATIQAGREAFAGTRAEDIPKIDCDNLSAAQSRAAIQLCADKFGM